MSCEACCDICCDTLAMLLGEQASAHDALMLETQGNLASTHSVVRHGGATKFLKEDPIEAASVEMILQRNA